VVSIKILNHNLVKLDHLCSLFGVFGHILRIKQEEAKKQNFFIEFRSKEEASDCIKHLNNFYLWEKPIQVIFSVQEIKKDESNYIVKEYAFSPLNREISASVKPSSKLIVSTDVTLNEGELKFMFENLIKYENIETCKWIITMPSKESAAIALMKNHGLKPLGANLPIVCNFYNL